MESKTTPAENPAQHAEQLFNQLPDELKHAATNTANSTHGIDLEVSRLHDLMAKGQLAPEEHDAQVGRLMAEKTDAYRAPGQLLSNLYKAAHPEIFGE